MPITKIRGNTQIKPLTVTDAEVAVNAAIQLSKIEDGLELIKRNGSIPFTGNIDAGNNRVINVATPISPNDAVIKSYADGITSGKSPQFTYTNGSLTRVDYDNNEYLTVSYDVQNRISQVVKYKIDVTITKTFNYNVDGSLASITQSEVYS